MIDFDDKDIAMVVLGVIAVVSLLMLGDKGIQIAQICAMGIGSIATGRKVLSAMNKE